MLQIFQNYATIYLASFCRTIMNNIPDLIKQLHSTKVYPEAAIRELMERKEESTPLLLTELATFVENYKRIKQGWAHIYILYILSYFKEQRVFPYIIKMMLFSAHWTSTVFDEHVLYNLERWMLCTYNGNMPAIKQVIEDTSWSHDDWNLDCLQYPYEHAHETCQKSVIL